MDLDRPDTSLELDGAALRALVEATLPFLERHLDSLAEQPAHDLDHAAERAAEVARPLPEEGRPAADVLRELFERFAPPGFQTAGPGYLAYIPGGGIPASAVADLVAGVLNKYVGVWLAAPALAQIEAQVVRWLCGVVGYGPGAGGILTSGGSLANFSAVVAARRAKLEGELARGAIYASEESHHSVAKAAMLAGFEPAQVRRVASDERFRVRLDALEEAIERDLAAGLVPFLVVGNAGTTNTGAVDDLQGLARIAEARGLWLHVDAAYGGFFALTERGRAVLRGLERADSITLDPHKGLFLPYGNGCLLARRVEDLRRAHELSGDYMPAMQTDPDRLDFCTLSPELSRDFRGLRLWLPLCLHGVAPFRRNLEEKLELARFACDELRAMPDVEIVAEPELSLLAFRLAPPGRDPGELDRLNEQLLERVNARRRVFLTSTRLGGRFVLRICVLSFRTHADRIRECLDAVREADSWIRCRDRFTTFIP